MAGAPEETLAAARPGTVLCGKYRVQHELARGGMGTVVVATHLKLDRPVAIKLLDTAGKDRAYVAARFLREARAAARLAGDHVVRILDLDETHDGTPFLVMELLDGVDLERLLISEGKVEAPRAVDWALQACAALAEAHACGIVHRDVKPANLLLVRKPGGAELIKLLDFGISKILSDEVQLTRTAATLGSPLFMSPEQLLTPGVVDKRSDVWSLGVTLYRLLAGVAPFDAADASALAAQIAARPPTPLPGVAPQVPAALSAVVMRCLEKDASERWPSVVALADALEPFRRPTGLGSAALVHLCEAHAAPTLSSQPVPVPAAAQPAASWTLSHDVPRPAAPVAVVSAPALVGGPGAGPRSRGPGLIIGAGLVAVLGIAGTLALMTTKPNEQVPAVVARPDSPPVVVAPVALDAFAGSAPVQPATAPRDAGAGARARPVKPATEAAKDPSELELK